METEFIEFHQPCPRCDSSDACSINKDGSAKCFSCNEFIPDYSKETGADMQQKVTELKSVKKVALEVPKNGVFTRIDHRNISEKTARKYGVKIINKFNAEGHPTVGQQVFPYYYENKLTATKIKFETPPGTKKEFRVTGELADSGLFGEQLFRSGGKYLTIVEGEYDALAAYEMLGSKWPVVSIKTGASGAVREDRKSVV